MHLNVNTVFKMNIIFLLFLGIIFVKASEEYPIVELEDGKLQGILQRTNSGKEFYGFQEIPYAKPPIGDLRLAEPEPSEKWKDVRDATKTTKICIQKKPEQLDQTPDPRENEDCLYLNVFTPNTLGSKNQSELFPVYVYIYGGMYIEGNPSEYNFEGFLDEDIVIVTMNFRSSALGLLSTHDGVIPGNLALKDQLLAFRWINKNIKLFGGDPEKVTIGGHSTGAISVGHHVLNTKEKGLFRAAIIQSQSPLSNLFRINGSEFAYTVTASFDPNIHLENTTELLKFLRTLPAEVITRNYHESPFGFKVAPTLENSDYENALINGPMYENAENGHSNHVPILTGITNEEALHLSLSEFQRGIDNNVSRILGDNVQIKLANWTKAVMDIKDMYTKTERFKENMTALVHIVSDLYINLPVIAFAKLHSKYADVYLYQFSYKGPLNGLERWKKNPLHNIKGIGNVGHCEELPFLYNYRIDPRITPSENDLIIRKRLIKLWANFIKHLNPTPNEDPMLEGVTWPKMSNNDYKYLDLSINMSVKTNPKNFVEWQKRMDKYFEHPRYIYV